MIKKAAFKIIEKNISTQYATLIKQSLAYNKGKPMTKCDAVLMPATIIAQPGIMKRSAKDQAFILVHEWIHADWHHHKLRIVLLGIDETKVIHEDYREMFITYVLDLWTNAWARRLLGYAPKEAIMPTDREMVLFSSSTDFITTVAIQRWGDLKMRRKIIVHCNNVCPELCGTGKISPNKK